MRNQPCRQGRTSIDVDAVLGEFFACVERIGSAGGRDRPPVVVGEGTWQLLVAPDLLRSPAYITANRSQRALSSLRSCATQRLQTLRDSLSMPYPACAIEHTRQNVGRTTVLCHVTHRTCLYLYSKPLLKAILRSIHCSADTPQHRPTYTT
jgi:hypothetical protein